MLTDGEYRVYMVNFPGDIKGAMREDADGFISVYINDWLSPKAKKAAFLHEIRHAERGDLSNNLTIREAESS
jgi:hypothetical protein